MHFTPTIPFVLGAALWLVLPAGAAFAQLDGHGPDAWRVVGVGADDVLNARMGPGVDYPVIETFAHDARGLEQITCVPYYTMVHFQKMSQAELDRLPASWCLMRSEDLSTAGWVAQRYLMEDVDLDPAASNVDTPLPEPSGTPGPGGSLIAQAQDLVFSLYEADFLFSQGGPHPLDPAHAHLYFSTDFVAAMRAEPLGASPLYGAQDFDGAIGEPTPDPDQAMLRGMITINVEIVNFGRAHTAVFSIRADPSQQGAPLRIFRVQHDDWIYPEP